MYINDDNFGELMHHNTLQEFLQAQVFDGDIAQAIFLALKPFFGKNLDELAQLYTSDVLGCFQEPDAKTGGGVLHALKQLLAFYGLRFKEEGYVLTLEEAKMIVAQDTVMCECGEQRPEGCVHPFDEQFARADGFLTGVAMVHGVSVNQLVDHARAWKRQIENAGKMERPPE